MGLGVGGGEGRCRERCGKFGEVCWGVRGDVERDV